MEHHDTSGFIISKIREGMVIKTFFEKTNKITCMYFFPRLFYKMLRKSFEQFPRFKDLSLFGEILPKIAH